MWTAGQGSTGKPLDMKLLCVILSFAVLSTGCYSHTTLTAESPQAGGEVSFRLKDGTYILSRQYQRVENGYRVKGKLVNKGGNGSKDFSGILFDTQINEAVTNEYDKGRTVGAVLLGVGLVFVIFALGINASMNDSPIAPGAR
jgi:hypothetical protein